MRLIGRCIFAPLLAALTLSGCLGDGGNQTAATTTAQGDGDVAPGPRHQLRAADRAASAVGAALLSAPSLFPEAAAAGLAWRVGPARTLVTTASQIDAFAQDGSDLAWITRGGPCGHRLHIQRGSNPVSIDRIACTDNPEQSILVEGELALADGRALWNVAWGFSNEQESYLIRTASLADRRIRTLPCCSMSGGLAGRGAYLPLAGSGSLLVYYSHRDAVEDSVSERVLRRVMGSNAHKLFGVDRPLDVAVEGKRITLVRQERVRGDGCGCNRDPVWSPDGKQILFLRAPDATPPWYSVAADLAVVNEDGTGLTMLTSDRRGRESIDWSHDGRKVVYSEGADITVANADGTGRRGLAPGHNPEWSPSVTAIAFDTSGYDADLFVINADGTGLRRLARGAEPTWSPDGRKIAFISFESDLVVIGADGKGALRLVGDAYGGPSWSPDGSKIAFEDGEDGIEIVNADGSHRRYLTSGSSPAWSPDGRRIAFSSTRTDLDRGDDDSVYESELYVVNVDGSGLRPLTFKRYWRTLGRVRSVRGATIAEYEADGIPVAVAISGSVVAVLTQLVTEQKQIEFFHAESGAPRGIVAAPPETGRTIAVGRGLVVFSAGRTIRAIDVRTRAARLLARTRGEPVGLSISKGRLAWAESVGGRGRIRALALPG